MARWGPTVAPYVRQGPTLADALGEAAQIAAAEYEKQSAEKNDLAAAGATEVPGQQSNVDKLLGLFRKKKPATMQPTAPGAAVTAPGSDTTWEPDQQPGANYGNSGQPVAVSQTIPGAAPDSFAPRNTGAQSISQLIDQEFQPSAYTTRGGKQYSIPNAEGRKLRIGEAQRQASLSEKLADEQRRRTEELEDYGKKEAIDLHNNQELEKTRQTGRVEVATQRATATAARDAVLQKGREDIARIRGQISAAAKTGNNIETVRLMNVQMAAIRNQLASTKIPTGTDRILLMQEEGGPQQIAQAERERDDLNAELAQLQSEAEAMRTPGDAPTGGSALTGGMDAVNPKTGKTTKQRTDELKAAGVPRANIPGTLRHEGYMK